MAAASAALVASQIGGAISDAFLIKAEGEIAKGQAEWMKTQADINERYYEMLAKDSIDRGDSLASEHQKKVNQVVGEQRAVLAAQGIEVDSGSAIDLQAETAEIGALDVQAIKNNAWRQAFGYKQEAIAARFQSKFAEMKGNYEYKLADTRAKLTLVSGGLRSASSYNKKG